MPDLLTLRFCLRLLRFSYVQTLNYDTLLYNLRHKKPCARLGVKFYIQGEKEGSNPSPPGLLIGQ